MSVLRLLRGIGDPGGGRRVAARLGLLGGTLGLAALLLVLVPRCTATPDPATEGLQVTAATVLGVPTGGHTLVLATARDLGTRDVTRALVFVDVATGAVTRTSPLDPLKYNVQPVEIVDHGGGELLVRSLDERFDPELRDASTGAVVATLPALSTAFPGMLGISRLPDRVADVVALADDRELHVRTRDHRSALVGTKHGISAGEGTAKLVDAAFLSTGYQALVSRDGTGFFVASTDGAGTGPRAIFTRVDTAGRAVWTQTGTADQARSPRALAAVVGDVLLVVSSAPAREVVAYDADDGHVRWHLAL